MKNSLKYTFLISAGFFPVVALADCTLGTSPTFQVFATFIICNINEAVIPLIFAFALVMFIWGVVQYVINTDDEAKKAKGRQFMIWGIIALVVMTSIWGLVQIFGNTFKINTQYYPTVKTQ